MLQGLTAVLPQSRPAPSAAATRHTGHRELKPHTTDERISDQEDENEDAYTLGLVNPATAVSSLCAALGYADQENRWEAQKKRRNWVAQQSWQKYWNLKAMEETGATPKAKAPSGTNHYNMCPPNSFPKTTSPAGGTLTTECLQLQGDLKLGMKADSAKWLENFEIFQKKFSDQMQPGWRIWNVQHTIKKAMKDGDAQCVKECWSSLSRTWKW